VGMWNVGMWVCGMWYVICWYVECGILVCVMWKGICGYFGMVIGIENVDVFVNFLVKVISELKNQQ